MPQRPSSVVPDRPVGSSEQKIPSGVGVRYLYQPGELEGGRRRATDPVWSLKVYRLCHLTPSCLPRGLSPGDELGDIVIHSGDGIVVAIGLGVNTIFCDPALGVEGRQRDLVQVLAVDAVAL